MSKTVADLKIGEIATIEGFHFDEVPLPLMEMGCIPGKNIELVQLAPLNDPLYIKVNDTHMAIRKETAQQIVLSKLLCDEI